METRPEIYVIADYGKGDLAFAEVGQHIRHFSSAGSIDYVPVQPFSTTETGFCAYQLALNDQKLRGLENGHTRRAYLFLNTAPRRDDPGPRRDNDGERLVYAKLKGGMEVVGVFSGESFSFLKPLIEEFRAIEVKSNGSQFRSRDYFPDVFGSIVNGDYSCVRERIDINKIPEPQEGRIAYVDGYGNIKTTTRLSSFGEVAPGSSLSIGIGGKRRDVFFSDGMFGVREGVLCLAPGSSGPRNDPFLEISIRGGSAAAAFEAVKTGESILIERSVAALRRQTVR